MSSYESFSSYTFTKIIKPVQMLLYVTPCTLGAILVTDVTVTYNKQTIQPTSTSFKLSRELYHEFCYQTTILDRLYCHHVLGRESDRSRKTRLKLHKWEWEQKVSLDIKSRRVPTPLFIWRYTLFSASNRN